MLPERMRELSHAHGFKEDQQNPDDHVLTRKEQRVQMLTHEFKDAGERAQKRG